MGGPALREGLWTQCYPKTYLLLSSVHCWPWSSSLDRQRQRPWAGSPEAVSSTCVVSGLRTGSMPLPWARREGQTSPVSTPAPRRQHLRANSPVGWRVPGCPWGGDDRGCGVHTLRCRLSAMLTSSPPSPLGLSPPLPPPSLGAALLVSAGAKPGAPSSPSSASSLEPRPTGRTALPPRSPGQWVGTEPPYLPEPRPMGPDRPTSLSPGGRI